MLGDFSVGKTSLIRRFVECQFSDQYLSIIFKIMFSAFYLLIQRGMS
jgi:GTPase SAR1 family protein